MTWGDRIAALSMVGLWLSICVGAITYYERARKG